MEKTKMCRTLTACCFAVATLAISVAPEVTLASEKAAASPLAQQIFEATGFSGGLIVNLGCGDGRLTAALGANNSYLVHGLDVRTEKVEQARQHIRSLGLYGRVSVDRFDGKRLPYADNLVNLLVVSDASQITPDEMLRALAPNGVAWFADLQSPIPNRKLVKPWPKEIDQWTHYLYDASGNAVAKDAQVGPPKHLRWTAAPLWPRSHEYNPSITAMVSAAGRMFYMMDEGIRGIYQPLLPERWAVIARDGFSGVQLWRRPFSGWGPGEWDNTKHWSTPVSQPRRLVAIGDRVYVTLGYRAPVSVLDAKTGELVRVLDATDNTEEIVWVDDLLLVRQRKEIPNYPPGATAWNVQVRAPGKKAPEEWTKLPTPPGGETIVAIRPESGEVLWRWPEQRIVTLSLAALGGRVCYHTFDELVCLDLRSGKQLWRAPCKAWPELTGTAGTLVMYEDVVLHAADQGIEAFAAATGKPLWKGPRSMTIASRHPADLLIADGLVWGSMTAEMSQVTKLLPIVESPNPAECMTGMIAQGFDPRTGQVKRNIEVPKELISHGHHVRCYRSKGTDNYLLWPKRGIEFLDIAGRNNARCDWTRGECSYGVMPCNGLVYVPPHPCLCYPGVLMNGLNAYATEQGPGVGGLGPDRSDAVRLERGAAYTQSSNPQSPIPDPSDWPTYRHDAARSGTTKSAISDQLRQAWTARVGGKLTAPIIADGRVFVASSEHLVYALAAADGKKLWSYTAGGPIDSPPTAFEGLVLFGCHDGYVYALRAVDGALAWRFRAAPEEQRIVAVEQVESPWPVPGSVLVHNGIAYFAAGRSSYLDGGIRLYGIEVKTGKLVHEALLDGPWPDLSKDIGRAYDMEGAKSDILTSDGNTIWLTFNEFDLRLKPRPPQRLPEVDPEPTNQPGHGSRQVGLHLMGITGFLDDTWHDRTYWIYSRLWPGGRNFSPKIPKSGQILVFDDTVTYALRAFAEPGGLSPKFVAANKGYSLIADMNDYEPSEKNFTRSRPPKWSVQISVRARGMVLAGSTLFLAGVPDVLPDDDPYSALDGRKGATLWAVSTADGNKLSECPLASPPVCDGMAAAGGRLYLSAIDGSVVCLTGQAGR
jgi:outer membrane protein assembly factor BamB/SAM-dependent methyltransferase